jgi:hypothetical protein
MAASEPNANDGRNWSRWVVVTKPPALSADPLERGGKPSVPFPRGWRIESSTLEHLAAIRFDADVQARARQREHEHRRRPTIEVATPGQPTDLWERGEKGGITPERARGIASIDSRTDCAIGRLGSV